MILMLVSGCASGFTEGRATGQERALVTRADLIVFPTKQEAKVRHDFAQRHYEWVEANYWTVRNRFPGDPDAYRRWREAAGQRCETWKHLRLAHVFRETDVSTSLWSLHMLRDAIGDHAYYQGRMPDPVPLEFFGVRD